MRWGKVVISFYLGILLCTGCRKEDVNVGELNIAIEVPLTASLSKTDEGEIPASTLENKLYSLSIWVFRSEEGHEPVSWLEVPKEEFPKGGTLRRFALPLKSSFVSRISPVDVFIVANEASIGLSFGGENASWESLNGATIGYSHFGTTTPVRSVSSLGLPMSAVGKNLSVEGEAPALSISSSISLRRAVSKLRCVFCKMPATEGNVAITSVDINGGQIPFEEYLFTENSCSVVPNNYVAEVFSLSGPGSNINVCEIPEAFAYSGQEPYAYEEIIESGIKENLLTAMSPVYLRESDKQLEGWIYYTINNENRSRHFIMDAPGDFARNHTWILYGYFVSNQNLQLGFSVYPWDYNYYLVDFSDQAAIVSNPGFQVLEDDNTSSAVITKVGEDPENDVDYYNVAFKSSHATVKGKLQITAPVGGRLFIQRIQDDPNLFDVLINGEVTTYIDIDPTRDGGFISIGVRKNPNYTGDTSGKTLTLEFYVETGNERIIDIKSEMRRHYTFILP